MSFVNCKTTSIASIVAVTLLTSLLPATPAAAFACNLNLSKMKARVVAANDNISTTSAAAVLIPGMVVQFKSGKAGCVHIQFVAQVATPTNNFITLNATIDNSTTGGTPNPLTLTSRGPAITDYSGNAANFIFTNVAAGTHTVRFTWSSFTGATVRLGGRSATVYFLP